MRKFFKISKGILALVFLTFFATCLIRGIEFYRLDNSLASGIEKESEENNSDVELLLREKYFNDYKVIKNLPYSINIPELDVYAKSAILIDVSNGNILYEKNADEIIPPASMTKLFAMYVVDHEVALGNFKYDQLIHLPPESWACNMPPHSSLMFLGEGQKVTLEELLLGLSIASGNDAAYALAYTVCGSMDAFVQRMNAVAEDLGLKHTRFVESSGYSELNTTTAREMAEFCRIYISEHPDSLQRFHSVTSFTYPKQRNLASGDAFEAQDFSQGFPKHIKTSFTQKNTNPLLGLLPGCDGLKTGYIDESGYNLSLTAKRGNTRFLSVTMGGPGNNAGEGQKGRIHDGTCLMEWAFSSFVDFYNLEAIKPYYVKLYGAKKKYVKLVPAFKPESITIPFIQGDSLEDCLRNVYIEVNIPSSLWSGLQKTENCANIKIKLGDIVLQSIPLVVSEDIGKANPLIQLCDYILKTFDN